MSGNRAVAYMAPGVVGRQAIDFPVPALGDRCCEHGVTLEDGRVRSRLAA